MKDSKNLAYAIMGLFFLIYATFAYSLLGNLGKYVSLAIGIGLFVYVVVKTGINYFLNIFFIKCFLVFLVYLLIALWNKQQVLEPLQITFSIINLFLLGFGFVLAKFRGVYKPSGFRIVLYNFLVVIGCLAMYFKQASRFGFVDNTRDLGDDNLNPVGVAYVSILMLFFIFWLWKSTVNKLHKFFTILSAFLISVILITTLSRGAIVFLFVTFLIYVLNNFTKTINVKNIFKLFLFSLIFLLMFQYLLGEVPFIENKFTAIIERFEVLDSGAKVVDRSSMERLKVYNYFKNNYHNFYLGEYNYIPYPHNQFMEIFMRWGLFGLPLIIFSLLTLWKSIVLLKFEFVKRDSFLFLMLLLFIFSYLQSLTSLSLEMNRTLWLGFGFITGYKKIKK